MSKTGRVNKTKGNLETVWQQLDNASSELNNALENLSFMVDLPTEVKKLMEQIDEFNIVNLKNKIDELLNKKG